MNELYQQILNYLESEETEVKLQDIFDANFEQGQKENFLKVWQQIKDLEFDIRELYNFLVFLFNGDFEKTRLVKDLIFDNIIVDCYEELIELYEENSKKQIFETENNKPASEGIEKDLENQTDLVQKYNNFINSSLFQNILVSQEMMNEKFVSAQTMQNEFYTAINAGDKIRAVAVLRILCVKGKLGSSFQNDKRYLDFWAGFLERHYGIDVKEKFLQNPIDKKYFIEFLRFILEKRLNFSVEDSAKIGAGLAALCAESGENEFSEMAYGDESSGRFVWSER